MGKNNAILTLLLASTLALLAMVISYISTNLSVSFTGEKPVLKTWCAFTDWISPTRSEAVPDDVVFINVSHDKTLIDVCDEFGIPIGNSAITDREKLLCLLEMISASDYRYVMVDVNFEYGYNSDIDSVLFEKIANMDKIVIPRHIDCELASSKLEGKSAYADYSIYINEDDFTKYRLWHKDLQSMPYRMYSELTGNTIEWAGIWYVDSGTIARKVVFPRMEVRVESPYLLDGQKAYLNMGSDILDYQDENWNDVFNGKIIVIGAFTDEDTHTTYAGELPGCIINYNAFLALMNGKHKLPIGMLLTYFMLFLAMAYLIVAKTSIAAQTSSWIFAKLFVLYSLCMTVICIAIFSIWGQAQDIFITSSFFSTIDYLIRKTNGK